MKTRRLPHMIRLGRLENRTETLLVIEKLNVYSRYRNHRIHPTTYWFVTLGEIRPNVKVRLFSQGNLKATFRKWIGQIRGGQAFQPFQNRILPSRPVSFL